MSNTKWTDRLRYQFDNFMSRGTIALIGGLFTLSLVVIFLASIIIVVGGIRPGDEGERLTFWEAAWESLMRTLDSGTMGGDTGWGYRVVMFFVTLGGVFVISTLIGVLTSGIEDKMDELRKGRSRVIESGHTVILGWSQQIFSVISELAAANENQAHSCIVIMADRDKVEMEDEIRAVLGKTGRTRIVCRTGNPIDLNDLGAVSLATARSIIVLSPESDNPDPEVIKTLLAILNKRDGREMPYHIVAEIRDSHNMEVARMVGKDEVELILVGDLIARIVAQTCRQSGLSIIYRELLDFGGDEIYFKEEIALVGKKFGEALAAYEDSAVIGLMTQSKAKLNPPMETVIRQGDRVIAISADDDTIRLSGISAPLVQANAIQEHQVIKPASERILLLGWNHFADTIVRELSNYVAQGSHITIVCVSDDAASEITACCNSLEAMTAEYHKGDPTNRQLLDTLDVGTYDYVIVLANSDTLSEQEADAATLMTLLHLRDIADRGGHHFAIVSEMLDVRNRALAEITRADDFIVSSELISLMLTQVSENKHLNAVFADLFDPEGSEVYLKPAANYVVLGQPVSFYTVIEAARRRGEVAFGYRMLSQAGSAAQSYGVVVNPKKSELITFAQGDRIALLAEN